MKLYALAYFQRWNKGKENRSGNETLEIIIRKRIRLDKRKESRLSSVPKKCVVLFHSYRAKKNGMLE